jgi:hypothetical protein
MLKQRWRWRRCDLSGRSGSGGKRERRCFRLEKTEINAEAKREDEEMKVEVVAR